MKEEQSRIRSRSRRQS